MTNQEVIVVYKWTANQGKAEELKAIYAEVTRQMEANEPDAKRVSCHFEEQTSTLIVVDIFANAAAVGFHLGTTAAAHFGELLILATPGEFIFCGDIPEEMKQAALGMGLQATFAPAIFGFDKAALTA